MNILKITLLTLMPAISLLLSSCTTTQSTHYSQSIPKIGKTVDNDTNKSLRYFELDNLSVAIEPLNKWIKSGGCLSTVLLIPMDGQFGKGEGIPSYSKQFRIMLGIKPKYNEFIFNPRDILVNHNDISTPASSYGKPKIYRSDAENLCYHSVRKENVKRPLTDKFKIPKDGRWRCFELNFKIKNIDPDEEFSVTLNNFSMTENIEFKKYEYKKTGGYGARGCMKQY